MSFKSDDLANVLHGDATMLAGSVHSHPFSLPGAGYVVCPEMLTGPAPPAGWPANMPRALKVAVLREGPLMEFRCERGHVFHATPNDIARP